MTDQKCPVCKNDSFLNPNLKILISPCFHKLCEQCVCKIFSRGYAPCPVCQTPLRRVNFIASTFEDVEVAREVSIRRRMLRYFKRRREEFPSEKDYNDYLEAFEDTVERLVNMKNEAAIKATIDGIRSSPNILNPQDSSQQKGLQPSATQDLPGKRARLEKHNWTAFTDAIDFKLPSPLYEAPRDLIKPFGPAGLSLKVINQMLLLSLKESR